MDRYEQAQLGYRFVRRSAATRPMAKFYGVIQQPLDELVYRWSHGAYTATSWLSGVEITMLTTTGARSGQRRTVPVLGLPDGSNMILVASNFGRPRHPGWYHNLCANRRVTIVFEGVEREMVARELHGDERARWFRRAAEIHPGFPRYQRWAKDRTIPVILLEPVPTASGNFSA